MILYISLYIYLGALSFLDYVKISKVSRVLLICAGTVFSFLIFWGLASLRWRTGTDWDNYYDAFHYFSEVYAKLYEPGFAFLLSFIRSQTSSFTIYLTIFSFLCLSLKFKFFLKYHKETIFTVLLLFLCYYFADIFAVRQNLAISLTLFSTIFIIERKPVLFAVFVAIATSIHFTAVLYFIAYYVYWAQIKDKYFYILLVISILFGGFSGGEKLLDLGFKLIGVGGHVGEKLDKYLNGDADAATSNSLAVYLLGLTKRCIFIPIFVFIRNKLKNTEPKIQGYFNLYIVGNIIYFLFAKDLAVFARASVPFLFFEIFLVAYTISYFKRSKTALVIVYSLVMIVAFGRFNALINSYRELYLPYYSIFDEHIEGR